MSQEIETDRINNAKVNNLTSMIHISQKAPEPKLCSSVHKRSCISNQFLSDSMSRLGTYCPMTVLPSGFHLQVQDENNKQKLLRTGMSSIFNYIKENKETIIEETKADESQGVSIFHLLYKR